MHLEGPGRRANLVDVLDRVLDKGIVVDAWMLMSVAGISLVTVEARIVVASIETYMRHASVAGQLGPLAAPPPVQPAGHGKVVSRLGPLAAPPVEPTARGKTVSASSHDPRSRPRL